MTVLRGSLSERRVPDHHRSEPRREHTAPPGASLTATLSNPPATARSWVALAAVGAPNPSYFNWTFIDALPGTTTKAWTVSLPAAVGQYEVRFFQGLTYNRAATSPTVTVATISPTPSLTSLAPARVAAGSPGFVLTVAGSGFVRGASALGRGSTTSGSASGTSPTWTTNSTAARAARRPAARTRSPARTSGRKAASSTRNAR